MKVVDINPAATLIAQIKGANGAHVLAGVNGNLPEDWYACDLSAHPWEPAPSPRVAIFCSAKRRGKAYGRAAGAKVDVDAGTPDADLLKVADALAEQLRAKIAGMTPEDGKIRVALAPGAVLPERKTAGAHGYDVYAPTGCEILPGSVVVIDTGVTVELPLGLEVQPRPRSGLATRGLFFHHSTIDADYRGPLRIIAVNLGAQPIVIMPGDRIAQLVFAKVELPELEVVDASKLTATGRGGGSLGSTGR